MGVDINFMFQARKNGAWVDIPCEYNGYAGRYPELFEWLSIGGYESRDSILPPSERGFPEDFAVMNKEYHVVTDERVLPKDYDPKRREEMRILMGEWGFSWLHADEVLNAVQLTESEFIGVAIDNFRNWDGVNIPDEYEALPDDWQEQPRYGGGEYALPEEIGANTEYIVLEVEYDLEIPATWFIELLQKLKAQYGEVRFVFGFS